MYFILFISYKGLCHGISGNGFCFLTLFQLTQNPKHLYRAKHFGELILECPVRDEEREHLKQYRIPDHPFSLFEGMGGGVWYLIELTYCFGKKNIHSVDYPEEFQGFPCFTDA